MAFLFLWVIFLNYKLNLPLNDVWFLSVVIFHIKLF